MKNSGLSVYLHSSYTPKTRIEDVYISLSKMEMSQCHVSELRGFSSKYLGVNGGVQGFLLRTPHTSKNSRYDLQTMVAASGGLFHADFLGEILYPLYLGGGLKYFLFSTLLGKDSPFD